ncbi:hypothetical protein [Flavobacterium piscis]|uniref:DUF3127 domain-containing protein n=1 Tax=Flavobacterium piscis TaxID=1114874 RepID=A0ABU1Y2G8_9FLAO|nr:hypothetical protein [Flavobacterium piscis]MDR7208414.1 hypothetical protein [Flavobacterium piscis]
MSKKCLTQKNKRKMVRIIGYKKRETEEGKEFFVLEIQGGVSMEKSKTTGKFYVTANKATISSTFDEATCNALIGTELEGRVEKVASDPYEYTIRETGEVITLSHRFEYVEEENAVASKVEMSKTSFRDVMKNGYDEENTFSKNGELIH